MRVCTFGIELLKKREIYFFFLLTATDHSFLFLSLSQSIITIVLFVSSYSDTNIELTRKKPFPPRKSTIEANTPEVVRNGQF